MSHKPPCPHCGAGLYSHSLTVWCMSCGWKRNRHPDPLPRRSDAELLDEFRRELRASLGLERDKSRA